MVDISLAMVPYETVCVVQIIITLMLLIPACLSDWKTRQVSDRFWVILGLSGICFMAYNAYTAGFCWQYAMMILGSVLILIDILWNRDMIPIFSIIKYAVMLMIFAVPVFTSFDNQLVKQFTIVPVFYLIFYLMYATGLIRGGADAKCLIVLSMMFQTYPQILSLPLISIPSRYELIMPFPLILLFHAALLSMFVVIFILIKNLKNGDPITPRSFSGYNMDIDEAKRKHVWPKEDARDGYIVFTSRPVEDPEVFDRLKALNVRRIWVTPIIPFIIPITVAFVFIVVIGNLFFLPFVFS